MKLNEIELNYLKLYLSIMDNPENGGGLTSLREACLSKQFSMVCLNAVIQKVIEDYEETNKSNTE